MGTLNGRTALVTGGSRGIGRAVVQRLAAEGAAVVFGYHRDAVAAETCAAEVIGGGGTAHAVQADLADLDQVRRLVETADTLLHGLDVVVNNAADPEQLDIAKATPGHYDRLMAVNARAPFFVMQHALDVLRDGGRVINISSIAAAMSAPGAAVYAGSKAALERFTTTAAQEFGPRGITVNAIAPGTVDTDMLRGLHDERSRQALAAVTPLRRLGEGADIAGVVAFLAGRDAAYVTGQIIPVNGGLR
ncbi:MULTISPECIES: SDR family NAD(P)-dependent oxidoreductase [Streptomyces]|uniref:SDR family NAD(P)-dependent oxidoreductase n=1 Tax=Streptomyces TaxID=1883 RepID=UPI0006EBE025|nr:MULTISPECIES: glucose 1-dehydrogenase [Streptomyces]MCF3124462.1 SDR family oxidoreductase [Streptomyces arenae]